MPSKYLVLRMLSNYVGEEKFLKGVSIYLKKHLFANSVTRDLWDGIAEASGMSPAAHMFRTHSSCVPKVLMCRRSWTTGSKRCDSPLSSLCELFDRTCLFTQMGFPVITVKETNEGINVRQDRFLETGPAPPEENETIWCVMPGNFPPYVWSQYNHTGVFL